MNKLHLCTVMGTAVLFLGGCYSYKEPPVATLGTTYTHREKDNADDLFKNITSLSLAEAQRIAIRNNPTYASAAFAIEAARMRYYQSLGAYSPEISADFSLQENHNWRHRFTNSRGFTSRTPRSDTFSTNTGVGASLLLFDGLARWFRVKAADSEFNYYKHMEEDALRSMMQAVAYAYNTVLLAVENRRIADENRKFQLTSLKDTQYKFNAGAVPLSDVLNFEIQVNNAEVDMIDADYQYETAVYALAVLMGYPEGTLPPHVSFSGNFRAPFSELVSVDVYLDAALANRPDLKAYRQQVEIAKYQLYQSYSAYSPTLSAFINFGYGTNAAKNASYTDNSRTYGETASLNYGIMANWKIFDGFIRYNKARAAKASLAIADYQAAHQWFTVVREVRHAYANYIQSVKQTKLYQKTRDLSAQQRNLVDDEYRAGNAELTRLNEAQRDLVQAETNLASSFINIQNAKAQLDAAVGANTEEYYLDPANDSATAQPGLRKKQNETPKSAKQDEQKKSAEVKTEAQVKNTPSKAPEIPKSPLAPAPQGVKPSETQP